MANKYSVTFLDKSSDVKKTIVGLSKTALRKSGSVVRKCLRENIPLRSKRFKNHVGTWVKIDYKTGQPTLQVGFYSWQNVKKRGKQPSHANPHWIEFGTKPHLIPKTGEKSKFMKYEDFIFGYKVNHPGARGQHVLRNTVLDNINEIKAAQEEYLAEISKTLEEAGIKVESWEEAEDDD